MDLAKLMTQVAEVNPMPNARPVRQHNPRVIAHMDGDYVAYFCAGSENCSAGDARRNVLSRCAQLKHVSGAGKIVMHLTHAASTKGDRFLAATTQPYQGQRQAGRKPNNWAFLREWMETYEGDAFTPKIWLTREADDGIAYVNEGAALHHNILHVVHSADKDMRMFCGVHVDWDGYGITEVPLGAYDIVGENGLQYGHKWFHMQMLHGDTADNIPGLPGVGKVTAEGLLFGTTCNAEAVAVVSGKYSEVLGENWRDTYVEQAALLWMRTDRDAELLDFLSLGCYGPKMIEAAYRLSAAVVEKKEILRAYQ
ncbi:DNA polymerase I [Xanthomonas phage P4]|uniref:DNA polymerase I n=1 Tax=Xanthomonas phage P4 TaxID=3003372 RepID=A0AAF0AHM3_9CAUD|nr:DNA polymerase I [Xanthomonas phage GF2]WAX24137.1 DNA polymerase I [Xanthomonas phage GF1]WAX24189.1 DNA polymerase I [Xanthomonas phage P4]WAX24223.1 DNA polymerase I [Xanthomonas phage S3]